MSAANLPTADAPSAPPRKGDVVRFLAAIPDEGIEVGCEGVIRLISTGDDVLYFIDAPSHIDALELGSIQIREEEAWMFEVLR